MAVLLFVIAQDNDTAGSASGSSIPALKEDLAPTAVVPSFDVVRIGERGDAVIAGRGRPGAEIRIFDGDREIGRVTADARGEWVFIPDLPMPAGARRLTLESRRADGIVEHSGEPVILIVPDRAGDSALVVQPLPGGGARLLQGPAAGEGAGRLAIDVVDSRDGSSLYVGGRAEPKADIHLYLDNKLLGRAKAGEDGAWSVAGTGGGKASQLLRADHVGAKGKVLARVEIAYEPGMKFGERAAASVVVESGASLWRIARELYGSGFAYTVIYQANKDNIRDPDLIYPGQVFTVPVR